MKVAVFGGAGYVGSMLVRALVKRGDRVTVFDDFTYGDHGYKAACGKWQGDEPDCPVGCVRGDAIQIDPDTLRAFGAHDSAVNLAGFSNDPTAEFRPDLNWQSNVATAAKIAWAAREAGVRRLIYASSSSIYHAEDSQVDAEIAEGFPVKPQWHYSLSKYAGEMASLAFNRPGKFDVCALRKGTISGPSFRMRFDLMLNTMYRNAMRDGVIKLHGGGWVYRPLLGISDAVSAYLAALDAPAVRISGQVFNVTSSNATVREYAEAMRGVLAGFGVGVKLADVPPPEIVRSYRISSRKFREQMGWRAQDSAESITRELHLAYRGTHSKGIKLPAFDDPNTENIRVIKGE